MDMRTRSLMTVITGAIVLVLLGICHSGAFGYPCNVFNIKQLLTYFRGYCQNSGTGNENRGHVSRPTLPINRSAMHRACQVSYVDQRHRRG